MIEERINPSESPSRARHQGGGIFTLGLLTFTVGLVLLVAAQLLAPTIVDVFDGALRDLGISLLIAGTVGLSVEYYTKKQGEAVLNQMMEDAIERLLFHNDKLRSLGLKQMCIDRTELDFLRSIRDAEPGRDIRMLAMCMDELTHNKAQRMVRNKLEEGCSVKLLLIDPQSPYVVERGIAEKHQDGPSLDNFVHQVRYRDSMHLDFVRALPPDLQARIELRHYNAPPAYFIVDNDTTMLIGFYLNGYRGEEVPHLELETMKGGAHVPFREHFDRLWALSTPGAGGRRPDEGPPEEGPRWYERRQGERRQQPQPTDPDRRKPAA